MSVIILLVLVSTTVAALFVGVFFWAVRSGQYEDVESPAVRILYEDKPKEQPPAHST